MAKEKSMQEKLASKYRRTKKVISRFEKYLSVTKEEGEWIKEHYEEFRDAINATETDKNYSLVAIDNLNFLGKYEDQKAVLIMSW